MHILTDPKVEETFDSYPITFREKLLFLRRLLLDVAEEEGITALEETLKWGEPSYLVKKGSTIRIAWKAAKPNQYAMYFKCTSKLVETFKKLYPDRFSFETTRAIVFEVADEVPVAELKHCIRLALTYHKIKALPNLVVTIR